jgi:hypothetical protein
MPLSGALGLFLREERKDQLREPRFPGEGLSFTQGCCEHAFGTRDSQGELALEPVFQFRETWRQDVEPKGAPDGRLRGPEI